MLIINIMPIYAAIDKLASIARRRPPRPLFSPPYFPRGRRQPAGRQHMIAGLRPRDTTRQAAGASPRAADDDTAFSARWRAQKARLPEVSYHGL